MDLASKLFKGDRVIWIIYFGCYDDSYVKDEIKDE